MINPTSKPKYCGKCHNKLLTDEEIFRIGFAGKKLRVCEECFDKYGVK